MFYLAGFYWIVINSSLKLICDVIFEETVFRAQSRFSQCLFILDNNGSKQKYNLSLLPILKEEGRKREAGYAAHRDNLSPLV
jgi:hypothetical protein